MRCVATLNGTVPMTSYNIARTGTSDEWVATATAADERTYTTTVTLVGGIWKYTLTSFPAATVPEVDAFLGLIRHFEPYLKVCSVSTVVILWG